MAPKGKKITLEDGRTAYEYPDGSIRNASGSYAVAPSWSAKPFTSEVATRLNDERWERYREAAAQGAMESTGSSTDEGAIRAITRRQTDLAQDIDKGHASVQAARLVGQWAGWIQDRATQVQAVQINVSVGSDLVREYARDYIEADTVVLEPEEPEAE